MKNAMRSILTMVAIMMLSIAAIAQTTVKGVVVDGSTNESLPGASIVVAGTTSGTVSGFDGSFTFELSQGATKVIVSFVGFLDKEVVLKGSQDLGVIKLESDAIGLNEINVMASVAIQRQTPVAVSTISQSLIAEKLGTQEFPEMLKSTPGVYATKAGGGYGDSRINLRGFDSSNIGVMINGVPVNGMENGKVYWSNWAGLSDVTRSQQVQRGLGASKVATPAVGGTINIITKSTDAEKGGSFAYGIGNSGMEKQMLTLSTGLMDNGWAVTFSGSHTKGDGWVKSTDYNGWSYFLSVAKQINDDHRLTFTVFGAPQKHNQRYTRGTIEDYKNHQDGTRRNLDYGFKNGERYNTAYNFYHKPQASLNHYWQINEKSTLSTSVYASISEGGGRGTDGADKYWLRYDNNGKVGSSTRVTADGYIDYDSVIADNASSLSGSRAIITNSVNSHEWYGVLSNYTRDLNDNLKLSGGVDARYYIGQHSSKIDDLLGGDYFVDVDNNGISKNINREGNKKLKKGDKIYYDNPGEIMWGGLFSQLEYQKDALSAFVSASVTESRYRRTDNFQYLPGNQKTAWQNFLGYSAKAGANYNLNEQHNVFVNAGYFEKAPFFNSVFLNYANDINPDAENEKVYSAEIGYGFRSNKLSVNVNGYYTKWMDKSIATTTTIRNEDWRFNVLGLDALHMGVEMDMKYQVTDDLTLTGMASVGDWQWVSNGTANGVNMDNKDDKTLETMTIYSDGLKVGDAAQTTAALGLDYQIFDDLKVGMNYNYYGNLYAYFNVADRDNANDSAQAWEMPDYGLFDLNVKYNFMLGNLNATLYGNVQNVFDTEYFSDATDGGDHDWKTSYGFYGFGRTASMRLKIKF
ncbi:TonB-dependent receptor [Labilibaculum antarcticum]|uniref:TonB-dependent receptor n=1 Tax=Labilibaculum antarcticum TaxID=1717717 RepID=A0A1Y1CHR3_9BACT|nr:TonB-dependent receptor [Labilibaculum antarcticum]BAX79874.1 TonB-dependent receptor [Labilibaculum antarcticum]